MSAVTGSRFVPQASALVLLGALLPACASHRPAAVPAAPQPAPAVPGSGPYTEDLDPWEAALPPALIGSTGPTNPSRRRVGDRQVHRFSGSYRDQALVLLEEVTGVDGELLVVDYKVLEGDQPLHLRVRMTMQSERVISVEQVVAGEVQPATVADYQALIAKTAFAPDRNDGLVARGSQTCLAGTEEFKCQVSRFDVEIDGQPATLSVARHPALLRDVAGELTAIDGTVLYKADLIEFQRGPLAAEGEDAVALGDHPDWAAPKP